MERIIKSFKEKYWLDSINIDNNIDNIFDSQHKSWIRIGVFETKKKVGRCWLWRIENIEH
jgi:hypothetical protein